MIKPKVPVIGHSYSVVCPSCYTTVTFVCNNTKTYGIPCSACGVKIDFQNPQVPLSPTDDGHFPEKSNNVVYYSAEVEESSGLTATAQVSILIQDIEGELKKEMPERMTEETAQAFSSKRVQKFADRFFFLFPVVWGLEYILFGRKPYTRIGHVRLYRKRIPFMGQTYFPAPKTTTAASVPMVAALVLLVCFSWFCGIVNKEWLYRVRNCEFLLVAAFYVLLVRILFADPGYVRPGYMDGDQPQTRRQQRNNELSLKEIEANKRESKWESVNCVSMERKWCSSCEMHRPVRAAHCYHCGLCCYDHDHHCGVLGICVGRRNAHVFALFVFETSCAILIPAISVMVALYSQDLMLSTTEMFVTCVMLLMLLGLGITSSFVFISMCSGFTSEATTRERIQNVYLVKKNPFDRGIWRNLKYHLWDRRTTAGLFDENFVKLYVTYYGKREMNDDEAAVSSLL